MRIKFKKGVFVRHCEGESIVWCPHYDGCILLHDSEPLLKEISMNWRAEAEIIASAAMNVGISVDKAGEDFGEIIEGLIADGYLLRDESDGNVVAEATVTSTIGHDDNGNSTGLEIFSNFCAEHGVLGELHIDLTDACTERCVHCYVPRGQRHFLQYELIEKALQEFRTMNGFTVHVTGGEPMLHPDFDRICKSCVDLNLNIVVFSNMTLCDESRVAFLKEIEPQFINVSLYSMDEEIHDGITGVRGSWRRTMEAVLRCCAADVHCRIATPLLRENRASLSDLKRFADEHQMSFVPNYEIVAQANHDCANLSHACSIDEMREVLLHNHSYFQRVPAEGWSHSCNAKVCDIGEGRLYLNASGDYYPCDSMHSYVLGSVHDKTITEIWDGEKMRYLRSLRNKDFGECSECAQRPWCKLCPAANFNATGNLLEHRPEVCAMAGVIREVYGKEMKNVIEVV